MANWLGPDVFQADIAECERVSLNPIPEEYLRRYFELRVAQLTMPVSFSF